MLIDVSRNGTVRDLKESLRNRFSLNMMSPEESEDWVLQIYYGGSSLQDDWILFDIGILPASTLRCVLQSRAKLYIRVYSSFNESFYDFTKPLNVCETLVKDLKSMIQDKSGIPVSAFRVLGPMGVEMYDCHSLEFYGINVSDTVHIEIWDGWTNFLQAALAGDVTATMQNIVSFTEDPALHRYQTRVALFIASHYGFIQLVTQLLKSGARCDDPVGDHPVRDWCNNQMHPDCLKTPAHEAAQFGRISCLRIFLHYNCACIIAKDGYGLTPCNLARRNKQWECFKFLITEQFMAPKVYGLSLSIYAKVKKWCDRARQRASYYRHEGNRSVLLASVNRLTNDASVGSLFQVDGYGLQVQASLQRAKSQKISAKYQWLWRDKDKSRQSKLYLDNGNDVSGKSQPVSKRQKLTKVVKEEVNLNDLPALGSASELTKDVSIPRLWHSAPNDTQCSSERNTRDHHTGIDLPIIDCTFLTTSKEECRASFKTYPERWEGRHVEVHPYHFYTDKMDTDVNAFSKTNEDRIERILTGLNVVERTELTEHSPNRTGQNDITMFPLPHVSPRSRSISSHKRHAHEIVRMATGHNSKELARTSLEIGSTFRDKGWLKRLNMAVVHNRNTILRGMNKKAAT